MILEEDLPLTYLWSYESKGEWKTITFPSNGMPKSKGFHLTAGHPDDDYRVNVSVVVRDTFGADSHPVYTGDFLLLSSWK